MARQSIGNFSLDLSEDWTVTTVVLMGPFHPEDDSSPVLEQPQLFRPNIVAAMEEVGADVTAQSYLTAQLNQLISAGVNRRESTEPEVVTLDTGGEGLVLEQAVTGPTGAHVRQMQLTCVKNNIAYTVVATDLDGDPFSSNRETFRKILLSFE